MDKNVHLTDKNERARKIYRVKMMTGKQRHLKAKKEQSSFSASQPLPSKLPEDKKHNTQMQFSTYQKKAAEINEKIKTDIQVNIETSKRQAAVSNQSKNTAAQANSMAKEAASRLENKLKADVAINRKSLGDNPNSPVGNKNKGVSKSQKSRFYLNAHQKERAYRIKPDNEARKRFQKAAQNTDKEYIRLNTAIGKQYYKIYKYREAQKRLDNNSSVLPSDIINVAENIVDVSSKVTNAVNKNSTGEAVASLAAVPTEIAAKKIIEKAAQKHKSIEKLEHIAGAAASVASGVDSQDSVGAATSAAITSVPKYYVSQKVTKTIKKGLDDHYKNSQEIKRDKLRAKQRQAAQRAEQLKREQAQRQIKINIYKTEHGITSSGNSAAQNIRAIINSGENAAKKAAIAKSSSVIVAAAGSLLVPIICVIVVVVILVALFAWMSPHTTELYNDTTGEYELVELKEQKEILQGYIKYIQQYFDKKQLEILEIVDFQFGGFEPDEYDYDNPKITMSHLYQDKTYVISSKKVIVGIGGASDPVEVTTPLYTESYYKKYPDGVYKTTPENAEMTYTIMDTTFPLEEMLNKWSLGYDGKATERTPYFQSHYTLDTPTLYSGMDITNLVIHQYDGARLVRQAPATEWVTEYAELYARAFKEMNNGDGANPNTTTEFRDFVVISKGCTPNPPAEDPTTLSRMDNHIWALNQVTEKYIKLSDYCDMESIIAMAAVKKWGDITAADFDSSTYDFNINTSDLDTVLQQIYTFDYSYQYGKCPERDCHRDTTPSGFTYSCNKTHQILRGQVNNWEYIYDNDHGDISFVKNKLGISGDKADIYNAYKEFISNVLGDTSTKLDDYETSLVAQRRLEALYEAEHGPRPAMPKNIHHTIYKDYYVNNDGSTDPNQHYFIRLAWDKVKEANSYIVYEYDVRNDKYIRCAGTTTDMGLSIDVGTLMTYTTYFENGVQKSKYEYRAATKNYLILAVNDNGYSKYDAADVYTVTIVPDGMTP